MTKKQLARRERLLPSGEPRYVRCYDNDGFGDRYTVVFSRADKFYPKGWYPYLAMSKDPFHPQGIGLHGEHTRIIDAVKGRPPAVGRKCHLGRRIPFSALPPDCRELTLRDYCAYWGLGLPGKEIKA